MASRMERYGKWALVAGAAEGLGAGFTTVLAAGGFNIILVDMNAAAMHTLSEKIGHEHHVDSIILELDLAAPDAAVQCLKAAATVDCRLLVYVAGYSKVCRFNDLDSADLDRFLAVNTDTLIRLVHGFTGRWIAEKNSGGIILVSSLAGLIGPQYVATYAATKSFSIRLAEALHDELKMHGIDISACCAGTVSTPTYWKSKPRFDKMKPPVMEPVEVASYAIGCLGKKHMCIPGLTNRLQYFFLMNLIPRRFARILINDAMDKMYG
jgi:short-subunit dehydrogenase